MNVWNFPVVDGDDSLGGSVVDTSSSSLCTTNFCLWPYVSV